MKNLSDDYLRSILGKKLKNYEPEPPENWDKIAEELPGTITPPRNKTGVVVSGVLIVLLSGLTGVYYYTNKESNGSTSQSENVIMSNAVDTTDLKDFKLATRNIFKADKKDYSNQLNKYRNKAINFPKNLQREQSYASTTVQDINNECAPLIIGNQNEDVQVSILDDSKENQNSIKSDSAFRVEPRSLYHTMTLNLDSIERQPKETKNAQEHWKLKITPFYNIGVFSPLNDNVETRDFVQSSNLLQNRLGLSIGIGYNHKLLNHFQVEYFAGYKAFSKNFRYEFTSTEETTIEISERKVRGLVQSLQTGISLKTLLLSKKYPIILSFSYEKLMGKKFAPYMGDGLLYYSIGLEHNVNDRIYFRPGISYGVPLREKFEHFVLNPLLFNVEIGWKFNGKN